nr:hypothetical protein [Tanacetum cinerariifolium]
MYYKFRDAFHRLFEADEDPSKPSNYNSYDLETRQDFKEDTQIEPQTFKEAIIQNMDTIEQCIVEREVKALDASLENKDCSRIVSDKRNDQGLENQSNTSGDESSRSRNEYNDKSTYGDDTDIRPSYDTEPIVETDQNAKDEHVTLANLVENLKLDANENKMIQKQLKKANSSLTQELKECKSTLVETSRTLGESNSIRDSYLIVHQNKKLSLRGTKPLMIVQLIMTNLNAS